MRSCMLNDVVDCDVLQFYLTNCPTVLIYVTIVQFSELYDKYNSRGLKILAFPCNQFGGQEPVSHNPYTVYEYCNATLDRR